jgi:hypothetical protein
MHFVDEGMNGPQSFNPPQTVKLDFEDGDATTGREVGWDVAHEMCCVNTRNSHLALDLRPVDIWHTRTKQHGL